MKKASNLWKEKTALLELKGVCYSYPDGTEALNNIDLTIYRGEKVAVIGPNGAGKTTLLKILDGLVLPTKGVAKIFGMPLNKKILNSKKMYNVRKRLGFVFQDPDVELFSATVWDDIAFGPLHLNLSHKEIDKRVEETLKLLNIENLKDKHPYNLSGGEKRKAAIAAVLSVDPEVLLLDEPTADLDPRSKAEVIDIINELNKTGKTIVTATQDMDIVPELADRVYVLNKELMAEGTPKEIFSDIEMLKRNNLEVPEVMKLFEVLKCFGYDYTRLPLSINEAIKVLTETIETEGGHIHLHIHEHTHEEIKKLKGKYNHHS